MTGYDRFEFNTFSYFFFFSQKNEFCLNSSAVILLLFIRIFLIVIFSEMINISAFSAIALDFYVNSPPTYIRLVTKYKLASEINK